MQQTAATTLSKTSSSNVWVSVCDQLRKELGEATYNSWIGHLQCVNHKGGEIILSAPTRFIRDWIMNNYAQRIKQLWSVRTGALCSLDIRVNKVARPIALPVEEGVVIPANIQQKQSFAEDSSTSFGDVGSPLDRRFTFDNYVVGESNRLAHAAAKSIADSKEIVPGVNPLFLHGGVGLGKTHLMHAIAWQINEQQPNRKVIYLSAEKFMFQFVKALRENEVMSFKENFRGVDVLMIDDVQFICGKEGTQEEFFHTVNALLDMNKQVVISGDRAPSDLDGLKERVKSRLSWGLVADIKGTDFELRLGILKNKVSHLKNIDIPAQVLEFLAGKIRSNVRELEGALNKVIAHASLMGKPVTLQTTQEILADLLRANERSVTIAEIQKKVAAYFNIKVSDMSSARRARCVARPRQIAMYLCKQLTIRSLSEIGRKFGGKDHTTVMHAVKKVEELCQADAEFHREVQELLHSVQQ